MRPVRLQPTSDRSQQHTAYTHTSVKPCHGKRGQYQLTCISTLSFLMITRGSTSDFGNINAAWELRNAKKTLG
jgi:hypothetical protein